MYNIFIDGRNVAQGDGVKVIEPVLSERVGCAGTLSYKIPYNSPYYDGYRERISIVDVYEDEKRIWRGRLLSSRVDIYGTKELLFEGELSYLNDIVYPAYSFQGDIPEFITSVLSVYNSRCLTGRQIMLGTVTVEDANHYINRSSINYASCWKVLSEKLADSLGGYFRLRYDDDGTRYLDFLSDPGGHNSQVIEFGKNLLELDNYIDTENLATVIYPFGARIEGTDERVTIETAADNIDGTLYIETPFVQTYGRMEAVVEWDDVTIPDNLYRKALAYAESAGLHDLTIEANVVDMHLADKEIESLKVGDHIICRSVPHGLTVELILSERERNLNDPAQDTITLGNVMQTFTESTSANVRDLAEEQEYIKRYNATLAERIETAKGMYTTVQESDGASVIYMHDKPTLGESMLVMNISDAGFHMSGDAGATWYGIDFNGEFLARYIETYKISADRIYGGTLSSKALDDKTGQPVTYIDMDSGEVAKLGNIGWIKRSSGNESLKWMGEN